MAAPKLLTPGEVQGLKEIREMGRKSLYFLCTELLGYSDVDPDIHAPFIEPLDDIVAQTTGTDIVLPTGECKYIPREETLSIALAHDVPRRYMLQAHRSSLKTSVNTIAHMIQLILNFPHIAILLLHNTEKRAKLILHETIDQFERDMMKQVYPEFAVNSPSERRASLSQDALAFTSPARDKATTLLPKKKEPTITALGLGTSVASQHFSVIKMTDVVEETNSGTPDARENTYRQINLADYLLEDPRCLIFVEGTPYRSDDAYAKIKEVEYDKKKPHERTWHFVYMTCYEPETNGKPRNFSPEEAQLPFKIADRDLILSPKVTILKGEKIPRWPVWRDGEPKFTNEALDKQREREGFQFACQMLLNPTEGGDSPLDTSHCLHTYNPRDLDLKDVRLTLMAVDTAETQNPKTSNHTAFSVVKIRPNAFRYVIDGFVGMIEAEEIVQILYSMYEKHRPNLIFLEETSFTRGLRPTIREYGMRMGYSLPIKDARRKTHQTKESRILGALRAPMKNGTLKFSVNLPKDYQDRLRLEMNGFPRESNDDILDTLVDVVSADVDLASYSDPSLLETTQKFTEEMARREMFQQWVNKITGRLRPGMQPPQTQHSGRMGF